MAKEYSKEHFWRLYKKLPQELKDALFAEETGDNIYDVCQRNKILENLDGVVKLVREVLMGLLPPDEFQKALEKEVELKKETAKEIVREINRFVFYPVKSSLAALYRIGISPLASTEMTSPTRVTPPKKEKLPAPGKEAKEDVYRESVE